MDLRLSATLVLFAVACGADRAGDWHGTIDTLANGAVLVKNPQDGLWHEGSAWSASEELRIGEREGTGPAVFGLVWDVEVDAAGRIYVLDLQAAEVRVFAPGGSHLRTIGRPGAGPGEFKGATGIAIDPAGRVWVLNQQNLRYSVFDSSGALVDEPPRPLRGVAWAEWHSVFTPAGDLLEISLSRVQDRSALVRYDTILHDVVDPMPAPPFPEGTEFGWGRRTLTPEGWWVGVANAYRLWNTSFAGDTLRIITRPWQDQRLAPAERDSAERQARQLRERLRSGTLDLETETRPIFERIVADDRGHVWVMLTPKPDQPGTVFDVFDRVGRYLGPVSVPDRIERTAPVQVRESKLYYVTKDEMDVQYVVRCAVR